MKDAACVNPERQRCRTTGRSQTFAVCGVRRGSGLIRIDYHSHVSGRLRADRTHASRVLLCLGSRISATLQSVVDTQRPVWTGLDAVSSAHYRLHPIRRIGALTEGPANDTRCGHTLSPLGGAKATAYGRGYVLVFISQ
jgi:hypothetical protein